MTQTICGVHITAFRVAPTVQELAEVLAHMPALDQADFFEHLAYALRNRHGYPHGLEMQIDAIAFGLTEESDSAGVELLERIVAAVEKVRSELRVNESRGEKS